MAKPKKLHMVPARNVAAILHLNAGHGVNGNPRRGYLVIGKREGWPIAYVDEGYRGQRALEDVIRNYSDPKWSGGSSDGVYVSRKLPYPLRITTTVSDLREWRGKVWNDE